MSISGNWFSAQSSTRHAAELRITGSSYQLVVGETVQLQGGIAELTFSDRVGSIPRKIYWPDGAMLETADNDAIDTILKQTGHKNARTAIFHRLERSARFALISLLAAVFTAIAFFKWGIPAAAHYIAYSLPLSVNESISSGSFNTLEKFVFEQSELEVQRQQDISDRFAKLRASLPDQGHNYRLYFRQLNGIPNALALPNGQVVVSDALVELVEHSEELDSILLHEIAHVSKRHGLQSVVRGSALSVIAALAIGDVSGTSELIAGLPVFLMQSSYSREFESEADQFAFAQMIELGIDPARFASIMQRMSGLTEPDSAAADQRSDQDKRNISEYLSSHPDSAARAELARQYSREHFR